MIKMNTEDFLRQIYSYTEHNVELRSFAEDRSSEARARPVFTRDPDIVEAHLKRFDSPGRGMFFGVCTRRTGASTGRREDLEELPALWLDVDCDKDGIDETELSGALLEVALRPTMIIESGGGIHAYWKLTEAIDVTEIGSELEENIISDLKRLANVFAGDPKVCELSRVMRLPGSHNSKYGEPREVKIVHNGQVEYELNDISDWLDIQRPMMESPEQIDEALDDPYDRYNAAHGYKPAIDIDGTLEKMSYMAAGENSIHETQLRISASMVGKGYEDDEIVEVILEATTASAGKYGTKWNWSREEKNLRGMIEDARKKFTAPEKPRAKVNGEKPAIDPIEREALMIPKLGAAVLDIWQEEKGNLLATNGELFTYNDGYWKAFDKALDQELEVEIQMSIRAMKGNPTTSTISGIKKYISFNPGIFIRGISFNDSGLIVCSNAAVDPRTGDVFDHDPEHYSLFGIDCEYNVDADCPTWFEYLNGAFEDQPEAPELISMLQEWFGAALVRGKSRELRKALVAYGPSRTGKTVLAGVLRALIGGKSSALQMRELAESFGRQTLVNSTGWIADDAISAGDVLDAENWKTIVSGEPVSIPRKNLGNWEGELDIPVMLTANSLPRVKDESDAVYNRTIFLNMTAVKDEELVAGRIIMNEIKKEIGGVLNWAIAGWKRLEARGRFDPPSRIVELADSFKASQDPCGAWMNECIEMNLEYMVDRRDLVASMHGYQIDAEGRSQNQTFGNKRIIKSIKEAYPSVIEHRNATARYFVGIKLNDIGLEYFTSFDKQSGYHQTAGSGKGVDYINEKVPEGATSIHKKKRAMLQKSIF
tara:strand:+ start:3962 stop:6433 length:2472 start_codon:yes stop_codon:yes gene_type:complete